MSRFVEGSTVQLRTVQVSHPDIQYIFVMVEAKTINDAINLYNHVKSWCMQNLDEDSWVPNWVTTSYSISLKNIEAAMMFRLKWT